MHYYIKLEAAFRILHSQIGILLWIVIAQKKCEEKRYNHLLLDVPFALMRAIVRNAIKSNGLICRISTFPTMN